MEFFFEEIKKMKELNNISIKKALNNGRSFYKLIVKVKKELVAYNVQKLPIIFKKLENILQQKTIIEHLIILKL